MAPCFWWKLRRIRMTRTVSSKLPCGPWAASRYSGNGPSLSPLVSCKQLSRACEDTMPNTNLPELQIIREKLIGAYAETVSEPLPERWVELIHALTRREQRKREDEQRDAEGQK